MNMAFWDNDASKFVQDRWEGKDTSRFDRLETLNFINKSFQGCKGALLEIGCGTGYWLRQGIWPSESLCGVDSSREMTNIARQFGTPVILADAHSLPLADNKFDAVIVIHVLEYSHTPQQIINEIRRVLKPGGRCCIITKNKFGKPWRLALWLAGRFATNPLNFNCPTLDDIVMWWGNSSVIDVTWLSARLITNMNDVNDAVTFSLPPRLEMATLSLAKFLKPLLTFGMIGKFLAWHMGVVLEKQPNELQNSG